MSQTGIRIDPLTADCRLRNLSLAIDEIKTIRMINRINALIALTEADNPGLDRRPYLLTELRFLNRRLQVIREKAELE